jgi:hypothetical protein
MNEIGDAYEFAFRGLLTEEALDRAGRTRVAIPGLFDDDIAEMLTIELLDDNFVAAAKQMAAVYVAIVAFENAARELVTNVLREEAGDDWWDQRVSEKIRTAATNRNAEEAKNRYHTQRGDAPITYTDLKALANIVRQNWETFEPFLPSMEWADAMFDTIERSRNVIMHSGTLERQDVARVGMAIRDWVVQVG